MKILRRFLSIPLVFTLLFVVGCKKEAKKNELVGGWLSTVAVQPGVNTQINFYEDGTFAVYNGQTEVFLVGGTDKLPSIAKGTYEVGEFMWYMPLKQELHLNFGVMGGYPKGFATSLHISKEGYSIESLTAKNRTSGLPLVLKKMPPTPASP